MSRSEILVLGKILGARGIQGNLRVFRRGDMLENLKKNTTLELYSAQSIRDGFLMEPSFYGTQVMLALNPLTPDTIEIKLRDLNNAEDAWKLKGFYFGMKLEDARKKFHNPDDPYLFEYLDLDIFEDNKHKGQVQRIDDYHGKQWLICSSIDKPGEEVMIPLQGPFIEQIDFAQKKIFLTIKSGLFISNESD